MLLCLIIKVRHVHWSSLAKVQINRPTALLYHGKSLKKDRGVFFWNLVSVGWKGYNSIPCGWILQADHSSKSTLPFVGLQHMQQYQVRVFHNFCSKLWSKWMVPEKWSPLWGLNPGPLGHEFSALTTRPGLLVLKHTHYCKFFGDFIAILDYKLQQNVCFLLCVKGDLTFVKKNLSIVSNK